MGCPASLETLPDTIPARLTAGAANASKAVENREKTEVFMA
jgi:hypothetical protein